MDAEEYVRRVLEACAGVLESWKYTISLTKMDVLRSDERVSLIDGRAYGAQVVGSAIRTAQLMCLYEDERPGHQPVARIYLYVDEFPLYDLDRDIERWEVSWWGRGMVSYREYGSLFVKGLPAPEEVAVLLNRELLGLRLRDSIRPLPRVLGILIPHGHFYYEPVMAEYLLKGLVWLGVLGE